MKIKIAAHPSSLAAEGPLKVTLQPATSRCRGKEGNDKDRSSILLSLLSRRRRVDDINILFAVIESICLPFTRRVSINGYLPRR